jgi:hypothetical protein
LKRSNDSTSLRQDLLCIRSTMSERRVYRFVQRTVSLISTPSSNKPTNCIFFSDFYSLDQKIQDECEKVYMLFNSCYIWTSPNCTFWPRWQVCQFNLIYS